jgi:hypothetical protein
VKRVLARANGPDRVAAGIVDHDRGDLVRTLDLVRQGG